ncbi:MAG TPA: hypothetical protein VHU86_01395 [Solirubrobacterales bacterium]|jgi:hypothetical protein|nr:hypothetical protein [Solirubrobacterales bacterium]
MTDPDSSINGAREDQRDASGYTDLVAEVEAIETAVDGSTTASVKAEVVALRNKVERPPLKADGDNEINSASKRKADVEAVQAVAQDLAERV